MGAAAAQRCAEFLGWAGSAVAELFQDVNLAKVTAGVLGDWWCRRLKARRSCG